MQRGALGRTDPDGLSSCLQTADSRDGSFAGQTWGKPLGLCHGPWVPAAGQAHGQAPSELPDSRTDHGVQWEVLRPAQKALRVREAGMCKRPTQDLLGAPWGNSWVLRMADRTQSCLLLGLSGSGSARHSTVEQKRTTGIGRRWKRVTDSLVPPTPSCLPSIIFTVKKFF